MRRGLLLLSLVLALAGAWRPVACAEPAAAAPLVLAVIPYLPAEEIRQHYAPLVTQIGRSLGRPIDLRISASYVAHINAVGHDQVDLALLGPATYVRVLERYGSKPLLARYEVDGKPELRGVIVVPRDSPVKTIGELRGRRFAFGDPESTMAYSVPAWALLRAGVPITALGGHDFVGSHANVALGVLAGDYDAGAVRRDIYETYAPRGLRSLAELPSTPGQLIVARSNLPPSDVERVRSLLLSLHETAAGMKVLTSIEPRMTRFGAVRESDYDGLRQMMRAVSAVE